MDLKCLEFRLLSDFERGRVSNFFLLRTGPHRLIADHELTDFEAMKPLPIPCQGAESAVS